jgi:hypothetical protein
MKQRRINQNSVFGATAPAPRPTVLGAALAAIIITFPVVVTILLMDLLML